MALERLPHLIGVLFPETGAALDVREQEGDRSRQCDFHARIIPPAPCFGLAGSRCLVSFLLTSLTR